MYGVAQRFEAHSLLSQAIQAYETGLERAPNANYYYQLAGLYAAQQNIEKMMERYLDYVQTNPPFYQSSHEVTCRLYIRGLKSAL